MKTFVAILLVCGGFAPFARADEIKTYLDSRGFQEVNFSEPNYRGIPFLAATGYERWYADPEETPFTRAARICEYLGLGKPTVIRVSEAEIYSRTELWSLTKESLLTTGWYSGVRNENRARGPLKFSTLACESGKK
jgi:hypothetical protein